MKKWPVYIQMKETGVLVALVSLIGIFGVISDGFISLETFGTITTVSSEIGFLALGATVLMIVGEFDLSVGSTFALSGMLFALLTESYGVNGFIALGAALLCGSLVGLLNGLITLKTKIPSFITTLGTMMIFRGLVLIVTEGFPIAALHKELVMNWLSLDFGAGFKSSLLIWLLFSALVIYLLNFHPFGSVIMATGGNEEAAYSMGIRVKRVKLWCFILSGLLSSLASVIQFSHMLSLSPTAGEQYELRAIAISVIGGTALSGGSGTVIGTVLATLIMGVLASGLVQAGVSAYWFRVLIGLILVLAVVLNTNIKSFKNRMAIS
jgi:simple sugar transport system permease protein